jgi:hypothetical protein
MSVNRELTQEHFTLLARLHYLCNLVQVSYSLHYEESPNTFWLKIHSCAKSEEKTTRSYSLTSVLELGIEHLEGLK